MATYTLAPNVKRQYLDNSGNPLASGRLYTVAAGGTYPGDAVTTYQTSSGTPHTNPIILDSAGRISGSSELYFEPGQSYKLIAAASSGDYLTPLWAQDNIAAVPSSNIDNDVLGTSGEALTATQAAYLNATTWFLADADTAGASTLPPIGFVVNTVGSGETATFRLAGRMTGFSGLTPGADYYLSATAGAITATPPGNARYVGRADSVTSLIIAPNPRQAVVPQVPCGRLTLTSNTPVTSTNVTAATTVYFAPYLGNTITLYDGTRWITRTFAQVSIAVPATTAQMYDVFAYDNAGTVTLELTAWTNDTTRATALTTQDGFYVKTGAVTRLYLGSFRTTAVSGQTEDSLTYRGLYNYFHRVSRMLRQQETTATWTYSTATWRQQRATATNQVELVTGAAEEPLQLLVRTMAANDTGSVAINVGIGEDSTTAPVDASAVGSTNSPTASEFVSIFAELIKIPAVGYHKYCSLEGVTASGTTTWVGASSSNVATTGSNGTGMFGTIRG